MTTMMTTTAVPPASAAAPVRSFADILSAMGRNPELRAAMRQHVLDAEWQQLPAAVRELRQLVGELQQTVAELQQTVGGLQQTVDGLQQTVGGLQQTVTGFMGETNARFDRLEAAQAETQADVAELKGDVAELKTGQAEILATQKSMQAAITRLDGTVNRLDGKSYEHNAAHIAPLLVIRYLRRPNPKVVHAEATPHYNTMHGPLTAAANAGRITYADVMDIIRADIILRDDNGGYCVAEVSITLDDSDITRARRRADLLAQATRAPAVPFVIGDQILDTSRETAAAHDVTICILPDLDD